MNSIKHKKVKLGLVMPPPRTEANSPRESLLDLNHSNNKNILSNVPTLTSKIRPPGPGTYDHHIYSQIGSPSKLNLSSKRISFGTNEPRKFTLNRSLESPFVETTKGENPTAW